MEKAELRVFHIGIARESFSKKGASFTKMKIPTKGWKPPV